MSNQGKPMMSDEDWAMVYDGERQIGHPGADGKYPQPEDFEAAAWFMTLLQRKMAEFDRVSDLFSAEITEMKARKEDALGPLQKECDRLEAAVEGWHRAQIAAKVKGVGKTVKFPAGQSKLRGAKAVVEIMEEGEFRGWLSLRPHTDDDEAAKGKTAEDQLYPQTVPTFKVSQLAGVASAKSSEKKPEPGTVLAFVDVNGEPVPGIKATTQRDNHSIPRTK